MKYTEATPAKPARSPYRPGTYVGCTACGRLLRIEWATRSIICSCGARITSASAPAAEEKPTKG